MNIIEAIFLGIIQGLTEFLPISSSGHLVLFRKIFDISEPALLFDTMLHAGTLVAVFSALWKDIWAILKKPFQALTAYLIIATVPMVAAALIFRKPLERAFETGQFLGLAFLGTSALLVTAELLARRRKNTAGPPAADPAIPGTAAPGRAVPGRDSMDWLDALVIGLMQALAVIPGVSRSGATLSGALSRGLNRDFAARFSFMLSIPAILGAVVFQLRELAKGGAPAAAQGGIGAAAIIAGTLSAAIVGFFAVRLMLHLVRKKPLWGFAVYTGILGLMALLDQFALHIVW